MIVKKRLIPVFLLVLMAFSMMLISAGAAHAEEAGADGGAVAADGGAVASNSAEDALKAFGSANTEASYSGGTLTIRLQNDIALASPVRFMKGETCDKVVLDLNGKTITGKAGVPCSADWEAAKGGNAIDMAADEFDVEIRGPGSVTGGQGAVCEYPNGYREGGDGGSAVFLSRGDEVYDASNGNDLGYNPKKLEHGLTVTGGAVLTGGAGAEVSYEDWLHNLEAGFGNHTGNCYLIHAGRGGMGIDQAYSGYRISDVMKERVFAEIVIENGTVAGGPGGYVKAGDHALTNVELAKIPALQKELSNWQYDSVLKAIRLTPADGGSGIRIYSGRKYVEVGSAGTVLGGKGGSIEYSGQAGTVSRYGDGTNMGLLHNTGDGGHGIEVRGDIGLTNEEPGYGADVTEEKYVGIRVLGIVRGGDTPDVDALYYWAHNAGSGIYAVHDSRDEGSHEYEEYDVYDAEGSYVSMAPFNNRWGTVFVESGGLVAGGNGGSAVCGLDAGAGDGGSGIDGDSTENINRHYPEFYDIVVNGQVQGGNGGDFASSDITTAGTVPVYGPGIGGYAIEMNKPETQLLGSGRLTAGDYGQITYRGDCTYGPYERDHYEGVKQDSEGRLIYDEEYGPLNSPAVYGINEEYISGSLKQTAGGYAMVRSDKASGLKAAATMTPFKLSSGPTTDTKLSCDYTVPSDYTGKVYIRWCAKFGTLQVDPDQFNFNKDYDDPDKITYDTTSFFANDEFDIEGEGTQNRNIRLLSDSSYPYCKKNTGYNVEVATVERMADRVKYNDKNPTYIYCYVMLEDGRIAKSNMIWFTRTKKSSTGWGAGESDVERVEELLRQLPEPADLTLDDENSVVAARQAYEALSAADQAQIDPALLDKLAALEIRLEELKEPDDPDSKVITEKRVTVKDAVYTGEPLTPEVIVKAGDAILTEGIDYELAITGDCTNAGNSATVTVTGTGEYQGSVTKPFTINKAANTMLAQGKNTRVKYSKVKKRTQKLDIAKVIVFADEGQGDKTYTKIKKKSNKKIIIKPTGKLVVKKGLKKGKYLVKVKVTAAGDDNHEASAPQKVVFRLRVK